MLAHGILVSAEGGLHVRFKGHYYSPDMVTAAVYASRARRVGIMSAIRRLYEVGGDEDDEASSAAAEPAPPTTTAGPKRYLRYGVLGLRADAWGMVAATSPSCRCC